MIFHIRKNFRKKKRPSLIIKEKDTYTPSFEEIERYLQYIGGGAGALALTGVAAASAIYVISRPIATKPLFELDEQCYISGSEKVHISKFVKVQQKNKGQLFLTFEDDEIQTLYDTFRKGAKESNNGPCLGYRESYLKPYQWIKYNDVIARAKNLGSGLVDLGLKPSNKTFVGIYAINCPEWIIIEQAVYTYSMVLVPLYDTLGPDACAFIINQTEMSVVICEDDAKCNYLLEQSPKNLKKIISMKEIRPATRQRAKNRGLDILLLRDVERIGAQKNYPDTPPKHSDLATICYTSGTTGNPKGVMITHRNIIASIKSVMLQFGDYTLTSNDVMISFLPLAHMLERCCENSVFLVGGRVGYYLGDIKHLADDMKALKPTIMAAVPRLLNRIYDKVQHEINNSIIKRVIFNLAVNSKENEIRRGIIRSDGFWDKFVFRKIQEGMGGKLRLMLVGSAPLATNVLTFVRCALGCLVVEGYGQTECTAPISLTIQGDIVPGHVGPPVACCCIKLVDVPDMEYYASIDQGEICVKGSNIFKGYFKDPKKTEEVLDDQGWHHTGDIGQWQPNGTLKIIDRKKHIFKLSQGEYIVPEKIENIYLRSQYVHQVFIHGESLKSCIVAIVVPDVDVIKSWASENAISGTFSVLCANPDVRQLILDDMIQWGKECGLKSFEQVKDIYLHPDPFSVQNGLLTPTLKSIRPRIRSYFKPQIEDMYQKLA